MNGWLVVLCAWIVLSVPVALFIGRMIRTADQRSHLDRDIRERPDEGTARDLPSPREHRDSA